MKVLVTGGAGYLGSILAPELLRAGHDVTVLDNFLYRQAPLLDVCAEPRLRIVRGDARERELVARLLKAADVILPLACITGAPACARDAVAARTVNLDAVAMLLELRSPRQRIVFPTTNSGYGVGEKDRFCTEDTPLRPVSLYGRLKVEAEQRLLQAGGAVTFRFATLFGASPRMRLDLLVNDFVHRAVTDRFIVLFEAHFKRNFLHVRDAAAAFLFALDRFDELAGRAYNVGLSDANLSKLELCQEIQKQVPEFWFAESPVGHDPDQRDYIVSNQRIEAAGFRPARSLQQGIAELVKACQVVGGGGHGNV